MGSLAWWADVSQLFGIPLTVFGYYQILKGGRLSTMDAKRKWAAWIAFTLVMVIWLLHLATFLGFVGRGNARNVGEAAMKPPNWDAPLKQVYGRTFRNQTIELDGREFVECIFEHVTFVYNGTAPTRFIRSTSTDHALQSSNPVVYLVMDLTTTMFSRGAKFT